MKRILHTILMLLVAGVTFAQSYPRKCTEEDIPSSERQRYYNEAKKHVTNYYLQIPAAIGDLDNREVLIDAIMATGQSSLKPEFLLDGIKGLTPVSPDQYFSNLDTQYKDMVDEMEFQVSNISLGDIMMKTGISCYIPVEYDLALMTGDKTLFKRKCRMYCLFPRLAASKLIKTMQVEPLKDIIAYKPQGNQVLSSRKRIAVSMSDMSKTYEQAVEWYNQGLKDKYMPVFKQLAEQGYTDAQWHYGYCLGEDSITLGESIQWLQKAVDKNHPRALNTLGYWYRIGKSVSKDVEKAFELFKRSAEAGWGKGACNLALAYENGEGCQQDFAEAEKWYVKAGELGYPAAYGDCAMMYWDKNTEKAREYLLKGVEKKDILCFALLALCYCDGILQFPQNKDAAAEYYKTVLDYKLQDKDKTYNNEWYGMIEKYYQEVKPWHDCKPENLFARLATDKSNPYIAKVNSYKAKKKDMDKYNKAIQKRHSSPDASLKELTKLAEAGMPEALAYIGGHWYKREQYTKAFQMYSAAGAKLDNCDALNGLGDCYYYGKHVPVNYTQAVRLYELAAIQDRTKTRFELGYSYYSSKGVSQSDDKAFRYFKDAAMAGSMDAAAYLGICYANGYGTKKDTIQAVEYFKKAAEGGIILSMNCLGEHYYNLKQYPESLKWYEMAANKGDADAQFELGMRYESGRGISKSYEKAVEWYNKAAEQEHADAQNNLGYCYIKGLGVPQSDENAVKWFTKAAEKGLASAQYNLGRCYENGDGISKSYEKAVEWYSKAANQGDARAQFGLGECYYNGWGVSKSYEKAVEWYTKAANQRHLPAQYKLGVCYDNAWGVTRSKANAVEWFIKAANLKYKEAIAKVEELKKKYKPANIPTPSKKGDYSGTVKTSGGIVYADDKKNIFVYIPNTDIVTMTDDKGRFFLRGVKNVNDVQAIVARTNKGKIGRQPRLSISGNFIKP